METLLIVLIVLAAAAYMGRKCWRAVAARGRGSGPVAAVTRSSSVIQFFS